MLLSLAAAALSGVATLLVPVTYAALGCRPNSAEGIFLAYCANERFADYEHGAYYLRLEPKAVGSLERAQVIVLGNSLAQMAFSTTATEAFFNERKLDYYLIGFGYTEGVRFANMVLAGTSTRPAIYIIHSNRFFSDHLSTAAESSIKDGAFVRYASKKGAAAIASWYCAFLPSQCGPYGSIYRSVATGFWSWSTYFNEIGSQPIPAKRPTGALPSPDELARAAGFAASLNVPSRCIVLTTSPKVAIDDSDYTRALAKYIQAVAIVPNTDGLVTVDGDHLDRPSAERWSKDFFSQLDGIADDCVALAKHR